MAPPAFSGPPIDPVEAFLLRLQEAFDSAGGKLDMQTLLVDSPQRRVPTSSELVKFLSSPKGQPTVSRLERSVFDTVSQHILMGERLADSINEANAKELSEQSGSEVSGADEKSGTRADESGDCESGADEDSVVDESDASDAPYKGSCRQSTSKKRKPEDGPRDNIYTTRKKARVQARASDRPARARFQEAVLECKGADNCRDRMLPDGVRPTLKSALANNVCYSVAGFLCRSRTEVIDFFLFCFQACAVRV